ncbi:MAG: endoribonuclease L-PSP [Armatimonadetes bacterium]|nr:endoribonuclease L-PSP [Armatimonadota bacterium]
MFTARTADDLVDVVTLRAGGIERHWVSVTGFGPEFLSVYQPISPRLGQVATEWVFGGVRYHAEAGAAMACLAWPLTWVQGDTCSGEHLGGFQTHAVAGCEVKPISLDGRVIGTIHEDDDARYCHLGGILPHDLTRDRPAQARQVFERLEDGLELAGMTFADTVRTWLFLDHLLDWYPEFNAARTQFFDERGVFDRVVPASTGIGGRNPSGAALVAGLYAMHPKRDGVRVVPVDSPLQCPATAYRSSFSRAVEVQHTGWRQLIVSGTASIAPDGQSAHQGDVDRQIELTMDVVEAILESRGMAWSDAVRGVVYFQDMLQLPRFGEYLRRRGLPPLPVVPAHAVVCRHDLLFEIELDAACQTGP